MQSGPALYWWKRLITFGVGGIRVKTYNLYLFLILSFLISKNFDVPTRVTIVTVGSMVENTDLDSVTLLLLMFVFTIPFVYYKFLIEI